MPSHTIIIADESCMEKVYGPRLTLLDLLVYASALLGGVWGAGDFHTRFGWFGREVVGFLIGALAGGIGGFIAVIVFMGSVGLVLHHFEKLKRPGK